MEDSAVGFLGVLIDWKEYGCIKLTQFGLTERIAKALDIDIKPRKFIPDAVEPLAKDVRGDK